MGNTFLQLSRGLWYWICFKPSWRPYWNPKWLSFQVSFLHILASGAVRSLMSRIDNCNGLLYGLSDLLLGRWIQNSAARLGHESISPVLHTLHWLPVKDRLVFKLLIIAYKCQHQLAPHYLQQLLQEYQPSRLLRSSTKQLLTPHNVVTKSYGQRSFQYSIPHLWNQLPDDIRECSSLDQFKSLLKSHLFVK